MKYVVGHDQREPLALGDPEISGDFSGWHLPAVRIVGSFLLPYTGERGVGNLGSPVL